MQFKASQTFTKLCIILGIWIPWAGNQFFLPPPKRLTCWYKTRYHCYTICSFPLPLQFEQDSILSEFSNSAYKESPSRFLWTAVSARRGAWGIWPLPNGGSSSTSTPQLEREREIGSLRIRCGYIMGYQNLDPFFFLSKMVGNEAYHLNASVEQNFAQGSL